MVTYSFQSGIVANSIEGREMISNSVQADGDTNIILQMIEYDRKHNVVTFGKIP